MRTEALALMFDNVPSWPRCVSCEKIIRHKVRHYSHCEHCKLTFETGLAESRPDSTSMAGGV